MRMGWTVIVIADSLTATNDTPTLLIYTKIIQFGHNVAFNKLGYTLTVVDFSSDISQVRIL